MSVRGVSSAVVSALSSDLSGAVFLPWEVPTPAPSRYAVVWVALSGKDRSRYASAQVRDVFTVTVHSVGGDANQCLWVQERVEKLTGKTLTVANRKLWPVEYITGHPPGLDDDGPEPKLFAVSQFDIFSDPA